MISVSAPNKTSAAAPTHTESTSYTIRGTASDGSGIALMTVNGEAATVSVNSWDHAITLTAGQVIAVTIVATNQSSQTATAVKYVYAYTAHDITSPLNQTHNTQTPMVLESAAKQMQIPDI